MCAIYECVCVFVVGGERGPWWPPSPCPTNTSHPLSHCTPTLKLFSSKCSHFLWLYLGQNVVVLVIRKKYIEKKKSPYQNKLLHYNVPPTWRNGSREEGTCMNQAYYTKHTVLYISMDNITSLLFPYCRGFCCVFCTFT